MSENSYCKLLFYGQFPRNGRGLVSIEKPYVVCILLTTSFIKEILYHFQEEAKKYLSQTMSNSKKTVTIQVYTNCTC